MTLRFSSLNKAPGGDTSSRPANPAIGDIYNNGELVQTEIYTEAGWAPLNVAPGSVSDISATDVGTAKSYNNGAATVQFTEPANTSGSAASFTAISSPGSYTATSSSSPMIVEGLQSGTSYTFTVTGTNSYGTSPGSTTSSITATTVPNAPAAPTVTNVTDVAFDSAPSASVAFTAPATGGKPITGYTVTSTPGSLTASGTSSPLVVTGLTAGTSYTYSVKATNTNGDGLESTSSSSLTASTKPGTTGTPTATRIGPTSVSLAFTDANNGGSQITGYTVTTTPSIAVTTSGTASNLTVTGSFANGQSYTFAVAATNANGTGSNSSSSNGIVPLNSAPFSMLMPTASALYVASPTLASGTYSVSVSPAATVYLSLLDSNGNTFYNGTVTNGASITLSAACAKAAAFASGVANVTLGIGNSPTAVTTTAAGAGSTTTLTSGTSYTPNSTGFGYVVAFGGGQGGSSEDVPGNDGYGGHGGRAAAPTGAYVKLTSGSSVSYTVGAQGNGGNNRNVGNSGGATTWGNLLSAAGATENAGGVAGGSTGGNSWFGTPGSVQPNPYSGIKSGTNGSGGGGSGNTGGTTVGGGSGIGTGGGGANRGGAGGNATGFAAGGGGAGDDFGSPGGAGSPGVIYVVGGLN